MWYANAFPPRILTVSKCIAGQKYVAYPKVHTPVPPSIFLSGHKKKIASTMNRNSDDDSVRSTDSLATPRAIENDDAAAADPPRETFAEFFYVNEGNRSLKSLAILSLGVNNDDGSPLFDPSVLPWSAALRPSALKMTANDLRNEVKRHCVAGNVPNAPRPNQWTVAKCTDWLEKNPIVADDEIAYIKNIIAHRISVAQEANLNAPLPCSQSTASSNVGTGNWIGKYPHLRLIHAIVDDNEIKTAYLHRLVIPNGRMAIENRRTLEAIAGMFGLWLLISGMTPSSSQRHQ